LLSPHNKGNGSNFPQTGSNLELFYMQDFATRSLTISEETPEVAMEILTEDAEVYFLPLLFTFVVSLPVCFLCYTMQSLHRLL